MGDGRWAMGGGRWATGNGETRWADHAYGSQTRSPRGDQAMWSAIRWLVLQLAAIRWLFKLGGLAFLIPIVMLLKAIGLPVLAVLSIVAIPLLILLFLFGLPIFLVLLAGGAIMGVLSLIVTIGVAALKFGIFVVLPIWLMWKVFSWIFRRGNGGSSSTTSSPPPPPPASPSEPPSPHGDPLDGIDPA